MRPSYFSPRLKVEYDQRIEIVKDLCYCGPYGDGNDEAPEIVEPRFWVVVLNRKRGQ